MKPAKYWHKSSHLCLPVITITLCWTRSYFSAWNMFGKTAPKTLRPSRTGFWKQPTRLLCATVRFLTTNIRKSCAKCPKSFQRKRWSSAQICFMPARVSIWTSPMRRKWKTFPHLLSPLPVQTRRKTNTRVGMLLLTNRFTDLSWHIAMIVNCARHYIWLATRLAWMVPNIAICRSVKILWICDWKVPTSLAINAIPILCSKNAWQKPRKTFINCSTSLPMRIFPKPAKK